MNWYKRSSEEKIKLNPNGKFVGAPYKMQYMDIGHEHDKEVILYYFDNKDNYFEERIEYTGAEQHDRVFKIQGRTTIQGRTNCKGRIDEERNMGTCVFNPDLEYMHKKFLYQTLKQKYPDIEFWTDHLRTDSIY